MEDGLVAGEEAEAEFLMIGDLKGREAEDLVEVDDEREDLGLDDLGEDEGGGFSESLKRLACVTRGDWDLTCFPVLARFPMVLGVRGDRRAVGFFVLVGGLKGVDTLGWGLTLCRSRGLTAARFGSGSLTSSSSCTTFD